MVGDVVRSPTSHDAPTSCMYVPRFDTNPAIHSHRKTVMRRGAHADGASAGGAIAASVTSASPLQGVGVLEGPVGLHLRDPASSPKVMTSMMSITSASPPMWLTARIGHATYGRRAAARIGPVTSSSRRSHRAGCPRRRSGARRCRRGRRYRPDPRPRRRTRSRRGCRRCRRRCGAPRSDRWWRGPARGCHGRRISILAVGGHP